MEREVYVGNGLTVTARTGNYKFYDLEKINKVIEEEGKVVIGMDEDWFFTAETIDKKFKITDIDEIINIKNKIAKKYSHDTFKYYDMQRRILGITLHGSDWATPCYENEEGDRVPCFIRKENK